MKRRWIRFGHTLSLTLLPVLWMAHAANADDLSKSGKELFIQYCAACHGRFAQGDGPVAPFMAVKVPNLTQIATRNGGKFPVDKVEQAIDGRFVIGAHGTREMPIWGERFMRTELGNADAERATTVLVKRLTEYLQSIQQLMTPKDRK